MSNRKKSRVDRKQWDQAEDGVIIELVKKYGLRKWNLISKRLNELAGKNRTGKQCRERWHNHLDPLISKSPWTREEENLMFIYHQ